MKEHIENEKMEQNQLNNKNTNLANDNKSG